MQKLSTYSHVKEILNCKLKILCQKNSDSFDKGMKNVRQILAEMQEIKSKSQEAKSQLKGFKLGTAGGLLRVCLLKIKH